MSTDIRCNRTNNITKSHLFYALIFLFAFTFRFFASQELPINSYEASILLDLTGGMINNPEGISIIESFFIKISFFIFGENDSAARIWPILAGSILTLLPLYLGNKLKTKFGILITVLIAIDPFMVVNSIHIGSNIFSFLTFSFLISAIWKRDILVASLNLILLFFSGRGLLLAIISSVSLYIYLKKYEVDFINNIKQDLLDFQKKNKSLKFPKYLLFGLVLVLVVILAKLDISLILSDIIDNLDFLSRRYLNEGSPLAFGVVLLSYLPFYSFMLFYWLVNLLIKRQRPNYFLILWIIIVFIYVSVNPYHKFFDLLWVSSPLLIFTARITQKTVTWNTLKTTNTLIKIVIYLVLLIALSLNFSSFIYQGYSGLSQNKTFISQIMILILLGASIIFLTHLYDLKSSFLSLINAVIILIFVLQLGFSFRASGLSESRNMELLWAGAIFDKPLIQRQVENKILTKEFSNDVVKIGLINVDVPGILWELRGFDVHNLKKTGNQIKGFDILISHTTFIEDTLEKYYGQEFIVKSFPKWVIEPIKNLASYDYWSWLIFRKSHVQKFFNNIWIRIG